MPSTRCPSLALSCLFLLSPLIAGDGSTVDGLIENVEAQDVDARDSARSEARAAGAAAVAPLADRIDASRLELEGDPRFRREVALTARAALKNLVHHAGRPGAADERRAVASELARWLEGDGTPAARREVLFLIGFVGGDDEAPAVAALLDAEDRHVEEAARLALERMGGRAATRALLSAARKDREDAPDLIIAVGKRGDRKAVPELLEIAKEKTGKLRAAALAALAHLAAAEAIDPFLDLLGQQDVPERHWLFDELLRLADNLREEGATEEPARMYLFALERAPADHQRERALYQASAGAGKLDVLIAGLADPAPRVRRLALRRLETREGEEVLGALREAYDRRTEGRAILLRTIAERDREAAEPLLEEASHSDDPALKLTALDIQNRLEDPALESTFRKVAEAGPDEVQPVAMKGYLSLAEKKLEAGEEAAAREMYARALDLAKSDGQRIAALRGLVSVRDPRALAELSKLLDDPVLAVEAARGVLAIATDLGARGRKDAAEEHLSGILTGHFPKELRSQAAEELRKLGRDPQEGARRQGFVLDWWLLTPIADPRGQALEEEHFPEKEIRLEGVQQHYGKKFVWQKLTEPSLDGTINLLTSFRRTSNVVTYAFTEIVSPEARDVLFKIGSDDGVACFLNGKRIHINNVARGLRVDQDVVRARLEEGTNRILLKIANGVGDWGFSFRITDPEGKPVDLSAGR